MKTFFTSSLFLFLLQPSFSQVFVGNVDINTLDSVKVLEVLIDRRSLRKGVEVFVDYGQKDNSLVRVIGYNSDNERISNPGQQSKKFFKSTAAVLNFLENNQWELLTTKMAESDNYFYFRRRKQ